MLVQNGRLAGGSLSFSGGGALACFSDSRSRAGWSIANARAFGSRTSKPQGYNGLSALAMPLNTGGKVSARLIGDSDFDAGPILGVAKMAATVSGEGQLTATGVMGATRSAVLQGETTLTALLAAVGKMRANLDAGARPSAFDVAQEVWQSQATAYNATGTMGAKVNAAGAAGDPWSVTLEGTFTAADLLRIASAVLAGNATGTNQPGTTVFQSLDGTKDRVTATQTEGARTITALDGS